MFDKEIVKFVEKELSSKEEVIDYLSEMLYKADKISDKKEYKEAVMNRESVMPTEIGYSIAIPHGESDSVKESFCACLKLPKMIRWNKEEVSYVFNIGVPIKQRSEEHIRILSRLCSDLMIEDFRKKLYGSKNEEELFQTMRSITKEDAK